MERSKNDWWLSSRGWTRNNRPCRRPKAQTAQPQKEEREPEDRLRSAHRVVQTIRRGSDADSRTHEHNLDVVQRSGAGYVEMADRWALCFLAGFVSGQRYQRRAGAVEGHAPGAQSRGALISTGRLFSPS